MDDNERRKWRERANRVTWAMISGDKEAIDEALAAASPGREVKAAVINEIRSNAKAKVGNDNA